MKRGVCFFLVLCFLTMLFPFTASAAPFSKEDTLISPNIAVYNTETGNFVYQKAAGEHIFPSTTAKLMTALVVFDRFGENLDATLTVTKEALQGIYGTAALALEAGEVIPVRELLYAMLVAGMNDAANALAIGTAGSISAFTELMNEKATAIGAMNTHYMNATGFDEIGAYTTASDIALVAAEIYRNKTLMEMCRTRAHTVPSTNKSDAVTVYTRNSLLSTQSEYYFASAEGMCVGETDQAGYTVVTAYAGGIYPYICVATGGGLDSAGKIGAYRDVKSLLLWAGNNFSRQKVLDTSRLMAELPVHAGKSNHVLLVPKENVYAFLDVSTDLSGLSYSVSMNIQSLTAPVRKGTIVGTCLVLLNGEPIGSTHLVTKNAVRESALGKMKTNLKATLKKPIFWVIVFVMLLTAGGYLLRKYFLK